MRKELTKKVFGITSLWILIISSVFVPMTGLFLIATNDVIAEQPLGQMEVDNDTVALWCFDEGSGQYINDNSSNGYNIILEVRK